MGSTSQGRVKQEEIPTVSFRVIQVDEDVKWEHQHGKQNNLTRALFDEYGYNSRNEKAWSRPKHYTRYIEPIESELAHQVEYDMDEQDREWVDLVNKDRQAHQLDRLSYELFEVVMDQLEKEWFALVKKIPTPASLPTEDSKCSICDDGEGENSNAIVFCDGCNLAVHQDCYGVPYIPEGQWLCRKCTVEPENPVDCIFCPAEAGAFKQTTDARWAHLLCAIWVPEVSVSNPVYMEPIEGVATIPKSRWKLNCSICRNKGGACIQCDNKNCYTAFHVTCARANGNLGSMKSLLTDGVLRAHCVKHISAEARAALRNAEDQSVDEEGMYETPRPYKKARKNGVVSAAAASEKAHVPELAKAARAHAKKYSQGPPLVPAMIVDRIVQYVHKAKLRRMRECVERICRYWSLKREARRGAPLLKRLYLEPWTASSASQEQTDAEKVKRLEYMITARNDLEKVRMLVELARKREKEKLRQAIVLKDYIDEVFFPHSSKLRLAFEKLVSADRHQAFAEPVSAKDVPDYYDIVTEPMCWSIIDERLDLHHYLDLAELQRDVYLVLDNAMKYNPHDHPFHKLANKIKNTAKIAFAALGEEILGQGLDLNPEPVSLSLVPDTDMLRPMVHCPEEDQRDLLAQLFAFQLEPLTSLPPLPKVIKPRPVLTDEQRQAKREEKKARLEIARLASNRRTRATATEADEDAVDESLLPRDLRPPKPVARAPSRIRKPKTPALSHASSDLSDLDESIDSDGRAMKPLKKKQTGVIGKEPFSPLTEQERRRREKQMEIVVDRVDSRANFARFNVGWVLPPGLKRGGRPVVASGSSEGLGTKKNANRKTQANTNAKWKKQPEPIQIKRASSGSSSDISTPPSSPVRQPSPAHTVELPRRSGRNCQAPAGGVTPRMSSPLSELQAPSSPLSPLSPFDQGHEREITPEHPLGENSMQELPVGGPGPQTLRNKRVKRQPQVDMSDLIGTRLDSLVVDLTAAEDIADQDAVTDAQALSTTRRTRRSNQAVPPRTPPKLTADSDVAETSVKTPRAASKAKVEDLEADTEQKALQSDDQDPDPEYRDRIAVFRGTNGVKRDTEGWEDPYPAGTLVWARSLGYPYFPAEVVDAIEDYREVPDMVWAVRPNDEEERLWLVRFFDRSRSYGWCPAVNLHDLGDDDATDQIYLSGKDKAKGRVHSKWDRSKKDIRAAYRLARASMLTDPAE